MWGSNVLLLVPQLILVPYLIRTIGEEGYGVYALVWPLMMSIEELQISLQQGVIKYSAGFLVQDRMDEVNKFVSSSFVFSVILAVLACAGSLTAAVFFKDASGQISSALVVMGIMVIFIVPLTPYVAVIQSQQRYYVNAIAETISRYISLFVVIAWFHITRPSVEALIIIMAGTIFLARFVQVPIAYRLVPGLRNHPRLCDREHLNLIISFGGMVVLICLCLLVNSTGVRWLMNSLGSTSFVAHLAIIIMPSGLLSGIIGAMTITAMPATSAYHATGNQQMLQELLIRGLRYTMILVLAGLFVAGVLMKNVLSLWVGPSYTFLAPYALVLFSSTAFMLVTAIAHYMLKGLGKLKVVVGIYLVGLVVVPITFILVVFLLGHNPYIAVTAGLVSGHLVCGCLNIAFCTRTVHADMRGIIIRVYAQPLCIAAAVWLMVLGILTYSGLEGLVFRILVSIFSLMIFFGGCYAFIATASERQQIKDILLLFVNRRK